MLFAVTVTSSVKLAGVLVIISLLVAPALVSPMMVTRFNLLLAWIYGGGLRLSLEGEKCFKKRRVIKKAPRLAVR